MVLAAPVQDALEAQNIKFVDVLGYRTRYYETGAGEPLVLFHGGQYGSTYSLDSWSLAIPALAKHFRVIAVDKLGQGYTDSPKEPAQHTFSQLLEHSIAFMDALGLKAAHLSGHSRGGMLIAAIALARPDLAKSLLIVSSATLSPEDPEHPGGKLYRDVAEAMPPGPPTLAHARLEPEMQAYNKEQVTQDFAARLLEIMKRPEFQAEQEVMRGEAGTIWAESLATEKQKVLAEIAALGLPCPTMHVWGANDKSWYTPLGLRLFDIIREKTPKASAHVVNHSGHYVFREQTDEFVRLAKMWCLGVAAG